jgi:hypothetical protein
MRISRKTGVVATAVVSSALAGSLAVAALSYGATGAAASGQQKSAHARSADASARTARAALPGSEAVLSQIQTLGNLSDVVKPVTDLTRAVAAADDGRLSQPDLTRHAEAIENAITTAETAGPAALAEERHGRGSAAPADVRTDAFTALQSSVDQLVQMVPVGSQTAIVDSLREVVGDLVNVATATLVAGDLPAADMAGLPTLPQDPSSPQVPADPASPASPDAPDVPVPLPVPIPNMAR